MAEAMEIYGFSEELEWGDIIFNDPSDHCSHGKEELELELDLDSSDWLISTNIYEDIASSPTPFRADLHGVEEYLMQPDLENKSMGIEEKDEECDEEKESFEIEDDIFNSMDMMECFTDPAPAEFMASHDSPLSEISTDDGDGSNISQSKGLFSCSSSQLQEGMVLSEIEYKGLRLLHLLMECAEAISKEAHDLAEVILIRLRGLVSPTGSTMERVAYYLYHTLHSKIDPAGHMELDRLSSSCDVTAVKSEHFSGALKLLHQVYPYIKIAHFTANQCILEAISRAASKFSGPCCCLHIVDFDIMEGMQWPPLMEAIKSGDYTVDHLKITAIHWEDDEYNNSVLYSTCRQTGRRLTEYAESLGIPFSFQERELQHVTEMEAEDMEIVVVNCMWGLPHMIQRGKKHVEEFVQSVGHLTPETVTVAMGPQGIENEKHDFLDRFSACLTNLCAIFDSLEAGLPQLGLARAIIERIFFGPAMCRFFLNSGEENSEQLLFSNVLDMPLRCGFRQGVMSRESIIQAQCILNCSHAGPCYRLGLVDDYQNKLVLKWGSTPLIWASTWDSPFHPS